MRETDVLILGAGLAGSTTALEMANKGYHVTLVSASREMNSTFAQGGIAYLGGETLAKDIENAGAQYCNPQAVQQLTQEGPEAVEKLLLEPGDIPFAREGKELLFTREAAHSLPRILYCEDQTGKSIMHALHTRIAEHPLITVLWEHHAVDLITLSHHSKSRLDRYHPLTCLGAYIFDEKSGVVHAYLASQTVLATGGTAGLYLHSSNHPQARGDGIAMAYRTGVRVMNMEYIQFHPTALLGGGERRLLLTEALRGEGGQLLAHDFSPLVDALSPRDVVSRAIWSQMEMAKASHVWLDVSFMDSDHLKSRFPYIYESCLKRGYDFTKEPLPIVPAAHYSCGGIACDFSGKTSMERLWAVGEVACNGVHGANRLASVSLLECLTAGRACAREMDQEYARMDFPEIKEWQMGSSPVDLALIHQDILTIKQTLWNYVGIKRTPERLSRAMKMLTQLKFEIEAFYETATLCPELIGLRNSIETALLIVSGALRNKNSLGCHYTTSEVCS